MIMSNWAPENVGSGTHDLGRESRTGRSSTAYDSFAVFNGLVSAARPGRVSADRPVPPARRIDDRRLLDDGWLSDADLPDALLPPRQARIRETAR
jgi:hypothetical protein